MQTRKGYYGGDSYTIDCVNCSMNHHSSSYTYIMCKLSSCFNVKDKIDFEHNRDLQIVLNQLASTIMWEKVLVE